MTVRPTVDKRRKITSSLFACAGATSAIKTLVPQEKLWERRTEGKLSQDPEASECLSPRLNPRGATWGNTEEEEAGEEEDEEENWG